MNREAVASELVKIAKSLMAAGRSFDDVKSIADSLLLEYKREIARGRVYENMGDKYYAKLEKFVGDIWAYPYAERLEVQKLMREFSSRVSIV